MKIDHHDGFTRAHASKCSTSPAHKKREKYSHMREIEVKKCVYKGSDLSGLADINLWMLNPLMTRHVASAHAATWQHVICSATLAAISAHDFY